MAYEFNVVEIQLTAANARIKLLLETIETLRELRELDRQEIERLAKRLDEGD